MNWIYELSGVRFSYGTDPVLNFDKLRIADSGSTALVGPNGAGKSTLLNILAFLILPDHGDVRFFGQPVTADNYKQLRRRVGYVQQKPYLFHASVEDNIGSGLKIRGVPKAVRRERVRKIMGEFGIEPMADRYAHDLSGGEAQKAAIARALVLEPEVLILDEPFSHLDRSFRDELEVMIREIATRRSSVLIFTTHDQMKAQLLADRVLSMVDGHILPMSVMNLFKGEIKGDHFDTGRLSISIPVGQKEGNRLALEATQLVLSTRELDSSMRNRFKGKIIKMSHEQQQVHAVVDAGEIFHVIITPAALKELAIGIGDTVWVSFKSSSVHLF